MRSVIRRSVPATVPATVGLAWTGLLAAELSGAPIGHDDLAGGSLPLLEALGVFGVAWVAMVVAMMVPSSYPLVRVFAATTADLPDRATRLTAFLVGYVAVWTLFGFALLLADLGVHAALDGSPNPGAVHASLIGDVLLVAGAFQLTGRKLRCLERCRHPVWGGAGGPARGGAAGAGAWGGAAGAGAWGGALRLGRSHGLACLGSCWALMLVVFALGSPQVAWMTLFGGLMVYEKAGRHGAAVARLAGAALLAASVLAALS